MRPAARLRLAAAALATLTLTTLAACSDSNDGTTPPPTPTIGVSLAAASATAQAGQSATVAVTVARNNGFAGAVDLTVEGAPAGVTATFTPASVASGSTTSSLALATTATTTPGTYNLVVRARGTGVADVTAPLAFTVTAPPPPAAIALALSSSAVTIQQGVSNSSVRATITRTGGFTGPVALTVTGLPAGATVPSTLSVTGDTLSIPITVGASTVAGSYSLTVSAAGTGVTTRTAPLQLTVTQSPPTGGFTVALAQPSVSVAQGASSTATLNITRTGGFTGGVVVTTSGAPTGLTVTAPTGPVTNGTATLTVQPSATLAAGSYPVTVTVSAPGLPDQTATLTVGVTAAAAGGFTLGLTPTTVSVAQGASATTTVNVARTGTFTGGVTVATSGTLPAGLTVTAPSSPITGATGTVTVAAAATTAPGTYTIALAGTGTGAAAQTASLTVTVTASSPGTGNTRYTFCAPELPIWFAYQDGTGAWTRVTAGANNTYAFNIGTRGGVAYVLQNGTSYDLNVVYGTAAELGTGGSVCSAPSAGSKRLTGAVAGLGLTDFASVALGTTSRQLFGQTTFTLDSVPDGPLNLLASRSTIDLATFSITPNKLILRRNVNYANGSTIPTLDFNGSEAFAPATANLTVTNLGADSAIVGTFFTTGAFTATTFANAGAFFFTMGTSPVRYAGVPTDQLAAGDLHGLFVGATGRGADSSSVRGLVTFFRTVSDRTVAIGPAPTAVSVSAAATTPYLRLRATAASQSAYAGGVGVDFTQADRSASVQASVGYVGAVPNTWELVVPDLTSAGFDPLWALRPATSTQWTFTSFGGNLLTFLGGAKEGTSVQIATRSGTFAGAARRSALLAPSTGDARLDALARGIARAQRMQRLLERR